MTQVFPQWHRPSLQRRHERHGESPDGVRPVQHDEGKLMSWQPEWVMQSIYDTDLPAMIEAGARAFAEDQGEETVSDDHRRVATVILRAAMEER